MEIWEPKPPGHLWATPGLLWDSFTLLTKYYSVHITERPKRRLVVYQKYIKI